MVKDRVIGFKGHNVSLYDIKYKKLEITQEAVNIMIKQNVVLNYADFDKVSFIVTRAIKFDPYKLFEVELSALVEFEVDLERTHDDFRNDREALKKHAEDKMDVMIGHSGVLDYISAYITQITSWFGSRPLIIPANVNLKEEDKTE